EGDNQGDVADLGVDLDIGGLGRCGVGELAADGFRAGGCGDDAGEVVGEAAVEEPGAHGHANSLGRCQLGDGREADGGDHQFADGVDPVDQEDEAGCRKARACDFDARYQREEADAGKGYAESELHRGGGVEVAPGEDDPQPGHDRCEGDDEEG